MSNRYKRKEVMMALEGKASAASGHVFRNNRPTAKATERMKDFVVVRLPQGIDPYADTHNIAYVQFVCFTKDRQEGIEDIEKTESMIEAITAQIPFDDALMSCNQKPSVLNTTSDGMGFHSTIIQTKIVIKV